MERVLAIETRGLKIGYATRSGERVVNPGLDLQLASGEVTALLGRNGAGKSTLLKTLCGLLPALGGEVYVLGKALGDYTPEQRASAVGVVLTEQTQAGGISVYDLVSLGRYPHTGFFGTLKEADHEAVRKAMETAGIADKQDRYIAELSDGERQKCFIAKVLAQECPVILLDEPTAFLDVTSRLETMVTLRRLAREQGKAVLLSTHDLDTALQTADKIWLLPSSGQPMICGTPDSLIADGSFERFFGSPTVTFDPISRRLVTR